MAGTREQEEIGEWDKRPRCAIVLWGKGLVVMEMERGGPGGPANNYSHTLDSVPNKQSISVITMGPYKNSVFPVLKRKLIKLTFGERLCIKKWDQGHEPTGTTGVGALVTTPR